MQEKRKRAAYCKGWDWQRVARTWKDRLDKAGVSLSPLFNIVRVCDPKYPTQERAPILAWWPANEVQEQHQKLQEHFFACPGTWGVNDWNQRQGPIYTLSYLANHQESWEETAAVLLCASLSGRTNRYRNYRYTGVPALHDWAAQVLRRSGAGIDWHHACTELLPLWFSEPPELFASMESLVCHLADEHIEMFRQYKPVQIVFTERGDPSVIETVQKKREADHLRHEQWSREYSKQQALREEQVKALMELHPRYGGWDRVSAEELTRLVWQKPTTKIAAEFGVSDVAVGKRCKAAHINKPPPGYWSKVSAGKIPHPNGVPVQVATITRTNKVKIL